MTPESDLFVQQNHSDLNKGRQSENNSTGVAFFGGASSSGGGGVTGPHYSARGLSPPGIAAMGGYPTQGGGTLYGLDDSC